MQGQRSTLESFSETFEFDHESNSSNSGRDQQIYWNNLLLNPVEAQNLSGHLLSPSDTNTLYGNMAGQESASLGSWSRGGPGSSGHILNQVSYDETEVEQGWASSLTVNRGGGPRIEESRSEATNLLSLENVNISLNSNQVNNGQSISQISNTNGLSHNSDYNVAHAGISSQNTEPVMYPHPHSSSFLQHQYVFPSGNSSDNFGNSSRGVEFLSDDSGVRQGGILDGRRLSCKRKNIDGVSGQSSTSGSSSCFNESENSLLGSVSAHHSDITSLNGSNSSSHLTGSVPPEEQLNPRIDAITRAVAHHHHPFNISEGNTESFQRNTRMRIHSSHQVNMSLHNPWLQGSIIRHPNHWSVHQPSSLHNPLNQQLDSRLGVTGASPHGQPQAPVFPGLSSNMHPFPWNGTANPRIGSSSSSQIVAGERSAVEESSSRSVPRNDISEPPVIVPPSNTRHLVRDPASWSLTNGSTSIPGNAVPSSRSGSGVGTHQSLGPNWTSHQNPPRQHHRSLSEIVRRSLFPSGGSESRGQSVNLPSHHGHFSTSQEIGGRQSGAGFRGHQQPHMRSAVLMDWQSDGVPSNLLSMRTLVAAREGRSRMISEIRNALDLIRRAENIRFEDIFILDQSAFFGGGDLHDRHRDMRLDVDNMSYEELLALEERIGNVNTGLGEEMISKCLKQRKYTFSALDSPVEVEPCCICQEEYSEGEELGTLDCRHDFHTACIKQWLMMKNLCPICKTTALAT
ncbi:putative E3 ubiquitin-protein ligase HIP1 [Cocos nucifera]|uniref:RING-type E3 ubiquitin transferase n=1 Tax=Cocos nucifera TaxID=13894 RepID=A0A8K0MV03_COCNU|nr:putative E3 ubiquitin-protein ligase HIP1 [Cocos nucifera]